MLLNMLHTRRPYLTAPELPKAYYTQPNFNFNDLKRIES
jgi:hypothetical protein